MGHTGERSQRKLGTLQGTLSAHLVTTFLSPLSQQWQQCRTHPTKRVNQNLCVQLHKGSAVSHCQPFIYCQRTGLVQDHLTRFLTAVGAHYKTHFQLVLWMCPCNLTTLPWSFKTSPSWLIQYSALNVFWILVIWLHDCKIPQKSISCPAFHE